MLQKLRLLIVGAVLLISVLGAHEANAQPPGTELSYGWYQYTTISSTMAFGWWFVAPCDFCITGLMVPAYSTYNYFYIQGLVSDNVPLASAYNYYYEPSYPTQTTRFTHATSWISGTGYTNPVYPIVDDNGNPAIVKKNQAFWLFSMRISAATGSTTYPACYYYYDYGYLGGQTYDPYTGTYMYCNPGTMDGKTFCMKTYCYYSNSPYMYQGPINTYFYTQGLTYNPSYSYGYYSPKMRMWYVAGLKCYITATAGGVTNPTPGTKDISFGANFPIQVTPDVNHVIAKIFIDRSTTSIPIPNINFLQYTFLNCWENHWFDVVFGHKIDVVANNGGSIQRDGVSGPSQIPPYGGTVLVADGEQPSFTIEADEGNYVASIIVNGTPIAIPQGVTKWVYKFAPISANGSITANFGHFIYIESSSGGQTQYDDGGGYSPIVLLGVPDGATPTLRAQTTSSSYVADVYVDGTRVGPPEAQPNLPYWDYSFPAVTVPHNWAANFYCYQIGVWAGQHGSVSPMGYPVGTVKVPCAGSQTFRFVGEEGFHCADVLIDNPDPLAGIGDGLGAMDEYTFENIDRDHILRVFFAINTYLVDVIEGPHGSVLPNVNVIPVYGANQTLDIKPDVGYHVNEIYVDGVLIYAPGQYFEVPDPNLAWDANNVNAAYTYHNVKELHSIEATFAVNMYSLNATTGPNGTITPFGLFQVPYGTTQDFVIKPDDGFNINSVTIDGSSVGIWPVADQQLADVAADHTIYAEFGENAYVINATAGENGSITPEGTVDCSYNSNHSFMFTPDAGFHIIDVLVDGVSIGTPATYEFPNVNANHTIEVIFGHQIVASSDANGQISPAGTVGVLHGANKTFYFTPNAGYMIKEVFVNGASIGQPTSYPFTNVLEDQTISVEFAPAVKFVAQITSPKVESGKTFSVKVELQNVSDNSTFTAISNVDVNLEKVGGLGTLTGTISGMIPAGQSQKTISGVIYTNDDGEMGVKLDVKSPTVNSAQVTFNVLAMEPVEQDKSIVIPTDPGNYTHLGWTAGTGANRIIVVKKGSAITETPVDGTDYTHNPAYGQGDQIGTAGAYVVGDQSGTTIRVEELELNTVYWVKAFGYNGTDLVTNYIINDELPGNPISFTTLPTGVSDNIALTFKIDNLVPNPAVNNISFMLQSDKEQTYTVDIIDVSGRSMMRVYENKAFAMGTSEIKIDLSKLAAGSYLLKVYSGSDAAYLTFRIVR